MSREIDVRVAAALGYKFWRDRETNHIYATPPGEDGPWDGFVEPWREQERSRYDPFDPATFGPQHSALWSVPHFSGDVGQALKLMAREMPGYTLIAPSNAGEPWAVLSDDTREVASHTLPAVAICHAFLARKGITVGQMARSRMLRDAEAMLALIADTPDARFRPYRESDVPAVVMAVLNGVLRANDDFSLALIEVNASRDNAEAQLKEVENQRDRALSALEKVQHERDRLAANARATEAPDAEPGDAGPIESSITEIDPKLFGTSGDDLLPGREQ